MALDFPPNTQYPNPPQEGDTWEGSNGIPYQYNGGKWEVYLKPSDNINHWIRESSGAGQDIRFKLKPRNSNDILSVKTYDVDRLPNLPATFQNAFSRFVIGYVEGEEYRGYFNILEDGTFMTGLIGDPTSQRIYATANESLMNMADYVAPAGVVVPEPTPITLPGYIYVSDDGSLVGGGY